MLVSEIIDRTYNEWLFPAGADRPTYDVLGADISANSTTIDLAGRVQYVPKDTVIEIGSELILIKDSSASTLTVQERGWRETEAAPHAAGEIVYIDPRYPRIQVFNALKTVMAQLWSRGLYVRKVTDSLTCQTNGILSMPTDAKRVISVFVKVRDNPEDWVMLRRSRRDYFVLRDFDPIAIRVVRGRVGAPMRVTYAAAIGSPTSESDDLDDLGVPETVQPALPMAVAGFLLQGRELPRIQVEELRRLLAMQGLQVPPGLSLQVGQGLLNIFWTQYVAPAAQELAALEPEDFELVR